MRETDWTRVLGWPGHRAYRHELNQAANTLQLWVRLKPGSRGLGVEESYLGKKQKLLTGESNLEAGEHLWFGRERKKETLDEVLGQQLSAFQRRVVRAACVDMWEPFRQSLEQWIPKCQMIYDKFHILQHAGKAVDEVRRAGGFCQQRAARETGRKEERGVGRESEMW